MDLHLILIDYNFCQIHNEEVRAFIDKVATMLSAKYPESVKNIVEKFSPSKGLCKKLVLI